MRQIQKYQPVESLIVAAISWEGFRRWLRPVIVSLLASLIAYLAWPMGVSRVSAKPATICVKPGGGGGCFASIQTAHEAASNGDTISVAAGTYTEDLIISKSISLIGTGASSTILLGVANNNAAEHIVIGAANVTIEGFTIDDAGSLGKSAPGANSQGITIGDVSGTILRHNVITNVFIDMPTGGTAVYLSANTKGAVIEQNTISNSGNGILFDGSGRHDNFTIRKNILTGNGRGTSSSRAAIRFVSADAIATGHKNVIVNNSFVGNVNGGGIFNASGVLVIAENNWWGCNFGPAATGAGCSGTVNGVSANVDANPWLMLRLDPTANQVRPFDAIGLTANLQFNSDNVNSSAGSSLSDNTQVSFTALLGTVAPSNSTTLDGKAIASFTAGPSTGAASISAMVDGQTISLALTISCPANDCSPVGPGFAPNASSPPSGQYAGSVLFFNVFTSSTNANAENTRINLTNVAPTQTAYVHLFFVDGGTGNATDAFLCLSPQQTASFLTSDLDPNVTGFLLAVAVNQQGCPVNFNYLIGDEYVKFSSGHAANLGAEAVAAVGNLPACAAGASVATLAFDGQQFSALPHVLSLDSVASRADGNDTLLLFNRIGGNLTASAATIGTLSGILFDDMEMGASFSLTAGSCQYRVVLSNSVPRTNPRIDALIPAGRTGWMKIWIDSGAATPAMTGAALNFNLNVKASAKAYNQGHNLHRLTVTNSASLIVPIEPPNC